MELYAHEGLNMEMIDNINRLLGDDLKATVTPGE